MCTYQELTFSREESFLGKKAGDRVGVGGCNEDEATSHQDQGPFVNSTFFWPAFASATTKINLQKFASIWTILPKGFGFYVRACHLLWGSLYMPVCAFNTVDVIGAGVVLKLNDGSLRCLVRVRSRSQLAPGHSDHPW